MVKLTQIKKNSYNSYILTSVYVNPKHIVFMAEEPKLKSELVEGKINLGLDKNIVFTEIRLNDSHRTTNLTVVGTPEMIESKINTSSRKLLRD